jgi:nucleoside triphosphatase
MVRADKVKLGNNAQLFPEPTVGALVRRSVDLKVLLVLSHKWPNVFTVPGGHVEVGETLEEALKREVKEEVGLDVKVLDLLSVQEVVYPKEFWKKRRHFIFFDFLCETDETNARPDEKEIKECLWVKPREALEMRIDRYLRHFLERYVDKTKEFLVVWKD